MPRSADSEVDRDLTARLVAPGLAGSSERYERWRRAGLLPRHDRHGAGRGHGSISTLAPATVEIAAALARHAVQGRDLRAAVIAWFFEAGLPATPGKPVVPEPPDAAVAEALAWAVRTDPGYRMLQRACASVTEDQKLQVAGVVADRAVGQPCRGPCQHEPGQHIGLEPGELFRTRRNAVLTQVTHQRQSQPAPLRLHPRRQTLISGEIISRRLREDHDDSPQRGSLTSPGPGPIVVSRQSPVSSRTRRLLLTGRDEGRRVVMIA